MEVSQKRIETSDRRDIGEAKCSAEHVDYLELPLHVLQPKEQLVEGKYNKANAYYSSQTDALSTTAKAKCNRMAASSHTRTNPWAPQTSYLATGV